MSPPSTNPKTHLFGATSMAGWALHRQAPWMIPFCNVHTKAKAAASFRRLNLDDGDALATLLRSEPPEVLIHCGGICDVDQCEQDPGWAMAINVQSMRIIVESLPASSRIVYLSSDHVFSGDTGPYDEDAEPDPITVYGKSRQQAETILLESRPDALVLRAGLAIGPSIGGRTGHLDWLRDRTERNLPTTIVEDEYRCASWAKDLALRVMQFADAAPIGVRHLITPRAVSRKVLAHHLNEHYAIGARIHLEKRSERPYPHLGHMQLKTKWTDELASPLQSVVPDAAP
jgi:dTDP-4-dehydrorhamnose reductase